MFYIKSAKLRAFNFLLDIVCVYYSLHQFFTTYLYLYRATINSSDVLILGDGLKFFPAFLLSQESF